MKKIFFTIILFGFCLTRAYCQCDNAVLQNAVNKLKTLSTDRIIEKAYLHFDKPYYAAGDTIYFKAYVMLGERHELSKLSGILNVDLISPKNIIYRSIKLQLNNGISWGDFSLPDSLPKGIYRVRAYTRYMQNDPDYFFDQSIPIGSNNSINVAENASQMVKNQPADIQFFPEGGDLVAGMVSKVAYKALSANGRGIDVKGVIVDNAQKEISRFSSGHLGMGTFYIQPEAGKTYMAKVIYADGSQGTIELPKVQPKGIVLTMIDTLGKMTVEVRCNKAYLQENINKDINLLLYSGGIVNSVTTKLDSRIVSMDMPKNKFTSGILQVTLFSQTGEPLSERLAFIRNNDLLDLGISSNKTTYRKRERVQVTVTAKNSSGTGTDGHFSVAVIDENKVPLNENVETTILSHLLLTADLKGYVEYPNYYFVNSSDRTRTDLDALLLTQGYRRFSWKQLLNTNQPLFTYAAEKSFDINGIEKTSTGLPAVKKDIVLRTTGGDIFTEKTDEIGKFKFTNLLFNDSTEFILQATGSAKGKSLITVNISEEIAPVAVKSISSMPDDVNQKMFAYLDNNKQQRGGNSRIDVKPDGEFRYALKKLPKKLYQVSSKYSYRSSSLTGAGNADQVIRGEDLKDQPTLSEALRGRLRGVNFTNDGVPYIAADVGSAGGTGNTPMLIIIDGNQAPNLSMSSALDNINPNDVETVELLKGANAGIYGIQGGAGVIVVNTKQLQDVVINSSSTGLGTLKFMPKGFYKSREFYTPRYENGFSGNMPDFRSTILWKPEVVTDKNGNASFEFYNGDGNGNYRLIIEGIDNAGNVGRQVYHYKVN